MYVTKVSASRMIGIPDGLIRRRVRIDQCTVRASMRVQCPSRGTLPYAPAHERCQRACCIAAQPSSSCRRPRRRRDRALRPARAGLADGLAVRARTPAQRPSHDCPRCSERPGGDGEKAVCARQLVLVATSTLPAACIDLAARLRLASRRSPYRRARSRRRPGALACSSLAAALAARVVSFAVCLHVLAGHTHTFARTATCSPYDCDRPKDEDRHGRRELDRDRQLDSEIEQEPYGRDLNESQKQQTTQQIYYGPAEEFTASVGCYRNSQPPILLLPNKW
jgi:hypothetical protein